MVASILLGSLVGMFFLLIVLIVFPDFVEKKHNSVNNNCELKVVVMTKSGDITIHCLSKCDANNILTNLYSEVSSDNHYIHIVYYRKDDNSLVDFILKKENFVKACATKDK